MAAGRHPTHEDVEAARTERGRVDPAVAAYAVAVAVGLVQALLPDTAAPGPVPVALLPYAAALVLSIVLLRRRRAGRDDLSTWLVVVAMAGVALATWVLARFAVALPDAVGAEFGFYRLKGRITTPLGDHNTAAGLLLVPVVASAVLAVRDRRWWLATAAIALGLVATLSRGAAAVLAVMVVAAFVAASRRRVAAGLAGALVVVVLGLLAAGLTLDTAPPPGSAPPGAAGATAAGPLGASVLGRIDLAVRGIEAGAAQPVTGVGIGRFGQVADDLPRPNDHAHQMFAHAVAEGGVPLLLSALVVAATLAVRALHLPPSPRRDLVMLGGLGLLSHAQIEILAGRLGFEVLLALLTGLAASVAPAAPDSLLPPAELP